jgi:hypothetical protein
MYERMKKYVFLFLLIPALMTNAPAQAQQKRLKYEAMNELTAYSGDNQFGAIIIVADNVYELEFATNLDGPRGSLIADLEIETQGAQNEYTLSFDAGKAKGALLKITCQGYAPLSIPINLAPNQAVRYYIDDPELAANKPKPEKHKLTGDQFFKDLSYERARIEYVDALKSWEPQYSLEVDSAYLRKQIETVDTILKLTAKAEAFEKEVLITMKYRELSTIYDNIYKLNPNDQAIFRRRMEAENNYNLKCLEYTAKADSLYLLKDPDGQAEDVYYPKLIEWGCVNGPHATARLTELRRQIMRDTRHVLTFEYVKGAMMGLSSGNYNNDWNMSGYFTIGLNPNLFELTRLEETDSLQTEFNISLGFTLKILRLGDVGETRTGKGWDNSGVWLFFGPGMSSIVDVKASRPEYGYDSDSDSESGYASVESRYGYHFALAPEAGLLFKLTFPKYGNDKRSGIGLAFRYTYQYRYALNKENVDLFGKSRHVIGAGLCF